MLKITEADGLLGGGLVGDRLVLDLRERDATASEDVPVSRDPVQVAPKERISQRERRAVGRFVRHMGHVLDATAVGIPLLLSSFVAEDLVSRGVVALFVVVVTLLLWPTHSRGRHVIAPSEGLLSLAGRVAIAPVVTWGLLAAARLNDGLGASRMLDVVALMQIVVFTFPLVLIGRVISYKLWTRARSKGYDLEDTLIVGSGPTGVEIAHALDDNPHVGLVPCGFVDRFCADTGDLPLVGHPKDLPAILTATGVRNVVIAFGGVPETELVGIVRECRGLDVQFYVVPRLFELGVSAGDLGHEVDGLPLVKVTTSDQRALRAKRMIDLVAAMGLLVLTAPVMAACALAVKFTSPGPVLFKQVRIGLGGRPFEILKFRTMTVNGDSSTQWSADKDDRVTAVGRFMRSSHMDELPQLVNVLKGDMSLVGPRPERPHFVEQFSAEVDGYEHRHRVPVGITGWAQVNGYWGDSSIERRVRLDNRYIENWSVWRDFVIALRTIPTLLGRRR
jgi:exopolysaccharide biosynthesis polyprenyl glycosylphosphotransferase